MTLTKASHFLKPCLSTLIGLACLVLCVFPSNSMVQASDASGLDNTSDKLPPGMYDADHQPVFAEKTNPQTTPPGVDIFGYTWDDTVPFAWLDASVGNEIFSSGGRDDGFSGPIDLTFNFPFYENSYNEVFVSTNGFLTFGTGDASFDNTLLPADSIPNNVIAPFWDDLDLASGHVYYQNKPGKLIIEWSNVVRYQDSALLTFEIILDSSGNILFQYQQVGGTLDQATVGIEDGDGLDGLTYLYDSPGLSSGLAVLFTRPAESPRLKILPPYRSGFVSQGESALSYTIRNTSASGSDIFDLTTVLDHPGWSAGFFAADGKTPLSDHDGDATVDTGALSAGQQKSIVLKLVPPAQAAAGDFVRATLRATSSDDMGVFLEATAQSALPEVFGQASADSLAGLDLTLFGETKPSAAQVDSIFTGNTLSLSSNRVGNYVYAWQQNGSKPDGAFFSDIKYAVLDEQAQFVREPALLTNSASLASKDLQVIAYNPSLASASNGDSGILWVLYQFNVLTFSTNANLYFSLMDVNGQVISPPAQVTSNTAWRGPGDKEKPVFNYPQLAALKDGRYFLLWTSGTGAVGGEISRLNYAIADSSGNLVVTPTVLAETTAGEIIYIDPTVTPLENGDVFIAYSLLDQGAKTFSPGYARLEADGSILQAPKPIPGANGWRLDATQLSSGEVLVAWTNPSIQQINYALLHGDDGQLIIGPLLLPKVGTHSPDFVSSAATSDGRAVLTWMDAAWKDFLYYALLDGSGELVTPPMIFKTGAAQDPQIQTSLTGQGVATLNLGWRVFLPGIIR